MYANGVLIANGGYFGNAIGINVNGTGDITRTHRLWQSTRVKNRIGSGVTKGDYAYVIDSEGIAECLEIKTGTLVWQERVKGSGPKSDTWSSMVLAGDRIYLLNQSGDTIILRASPTFEQIGINSIGNELTNASTVISDGEIFIRTHRHLWCIGTPPKTVSR
jgi:outer membrane protein assembly factor BamB